MNRLRNFIFLLLAIALLLGSCKRKPFDPSEYEKLKYVYMPAPPPPKAYVLRAEIGGSPWSAAGSARVNGDTMIVSGTSKGRTLMMKFVGYKGGRGTLFNIGHREDSAALSRDSEPAFEYASIEKASGNIRLLRLDERYNQVEAEFSMVLYSLDGDSIQISKGYFKINFTPNFIMWNENNFNYPNADSIWTATPNSNSFEVYGLDTATKARIKLVLPKNPRKGFGQDYTIGEENGLPQAYYSVPSVGDFQAFRGYGKIKIISNSDNVIKGTFTGLRFGGTDAEDDYIYDISDGTYSAKY